MDDEPLPNLGSLGANLAWEFHERGRGGLKAMLAVFVADGRCYRELLWQPAAELMALGLRKPAVMVRNASLKCESLTNLEAFWPYSCEYNPVSARAAEASAERRVSRDRAEAAKLLAKVGLDVSWLDGELIQSAEGIKVER